MKTFDSLTKKEKETFRIFSIYSIPYVIGLSTMMITILIIGVVVCIFVASDGKLNAIFGLISWMLMISMYFIMIYFSRKYKKQMRQIFGFDDLEKGMLKEEK